jgi:hypothetical protein
MIQNRKTFKNLSGFIISFVLFIAFLSIGEVLVGFFSQDITIHLPRSTVLDPNGFLWHKPNIHTKLFMPETFNWSLSYNEFGMRDLPRQIAKAKKRVAVLGDSYVEGLQLSDSDTVTQKMQKLLGGDWEVLNFGMTGIGTTESLLVYKNIVEKFDPDLVVLMFYVGNDVRNNSLVLESLRNNLSQPDQMMIRPYLVETSNKKYTFQLPKSSNVNHRGALVKISEWLAIHSGVYRFIHDQMGLSKIKSCPIQPLPADLERDLPFQGRNLSAGVFLKDNTSKTWEKAWDTTYEALRLLNEEVKSQKHKLIVAAIPYAIDLERERQEMEKRFGYDVKGDCQKNFMLNDLNYKVDFISQAMPVKLPDNFDFDSPAERLSSFAKSNDIDFVDFTKTYRRRYQAGEKDFWKTDRHWTKAGAEAAANEIVPVILSPNGH